MAAVGRFTAASSSSVIKSLVTAFTGLLGWPTFVDFCSILAMP